MVRTIPLEEIEPGYIFDNEGGIVPLDYAVVNARQACYTIMDYQPKTRNPCRGQIGFVYQPHAKVVFAQLNAIDETAESPHAFWDAMNSFVERSEAQFEILHAVRRRVRDSLNLAVHARPLRVGQAAGRGQAARQRDGPRSARARHRRPADRARLDRAGVL